MITRLTYWITERGDMVQAEATLLDRNWEIVCTRLLTLGPFDEPGERLADALIDLRAWFQTHGEQLELSDVLEAP